MDSAQRMMTIQVELDSRRLGGSALLIPFADSMLASTTCRQLLQQVLAEHLDKPDLHATSEKVSMFIIKQHDNVLGYGEQGECCVKRRPLLVELPQTLWILVLLLVMRKNKMLKRWRRNVPPHRVVHGAILGMLAQGM